MSRNRELGGSFDTAIITTSVTVRSGLDAAFVNAANGTPVTLTLDPNALTGDQIVIMDVAGNADTQAITINASAGQTIVGIGSNMTLRAQYGGVLLTYNADIGWVSQQIAGVGGVPTAFAYAASADLTLTATPATITGLSQAVVTPPGATLLIATTSLQVTNDAGGAAAITSRLTVDGTPVDSVVAQIAAASQKIVITRAINITPTSGSHTYAAQASSATGSPVAEGGGTDPCRLMLQFY